MHEKALLDEALFYGIVPNVHTNLTNKYLVNLIDEARTNKEEDIIMTNKEEVDRLLAFVAEEFKHFAKKCEFVRTRLITPEHTQLFQSAKPQSECFGFSEVSRGNPVPQPIGPLQSYVGIADDKIFQLLHKIAHVLANYMERECSLSVTIVPVDCRVCKNSYFIFGARSQDCSGYYLVWNHPSNPLQRIDKTFPELLTK